MACNNEKSGPNCTVNDDDSGSLDSVMICMEIFFLLTICVEFLVSFENPKNRLAQIKDIEQIFKRYFYGHFIHDLIPLIPLQAIPLCISGRRSG